MMRVRRGEPHTYRFAPQAWAVRASSGGILPRNHARGVWGSHLSGARRPRSRACRASTFSRPLRCSTERPGLPGAARPSERPGAANPRGRDRTRARPSFKRTSRLAVQRSRLRGESGRARRAPSSASARGKPARQLDLSPCSHRGHAASLRRNHSSPHTLWTRYIYRR